MNSFPLIIKFNIYPRVFDLNFIKIKIETNAMIKYEIYLNDDEPLYFIFY